MYLHRVFVICSLAILFSLNADAQVRLGIKGGLSSSDIPAGHLLILDQSDANRFSLSVDEAKFGLHLGMFIQVQLGHFFMQPEFLFNTVTMDYAIEDLQQGTPRQIKDEIYRHLDAPLIVGLKTGPVRFGAGPVGHLLLDSTSDLHDIDGYTPVFERFSWGWQAGIGLDIWKLHLDVRYEGNFNHYGDHFTFYGRPYRFSESPSRLIASAGISF